MAVEFTQLPGAKEIVFYVIRAPEHGMYVLHGNDVPPEQPGRTLMNTFTYGSVPYSSGKIRLMSPAIDPSSPIQSIADMGVSGGETIPLISYSKPGPATTVGEKAWAILISGACLLYTSPSPRDVEESRMPSSA